MEWRRRKLGDDEAETVKHVVVLALKQRNIDKLDAELLKVSDPDSPQYLQHWSRSQVIDFTRPHSSSTLAVDRHLKASGFETRQSTGGEYIRATGSISAWNRLLGTTFHEFVSIGNLDSEQEHVPTTIYRAIDDISIPQELRPHISALFNVVFNEDFALSKASKAFKRLRPRLKKLDEEQVIFEGINVEPDTTEYMVRRLTGGIYANNMVTPALLHLVYGIRNTLGRKDTIQGIYSSLGQYFSSRDIATFRSTFSLKPLVAGEITDLNRRDNDDACVFDPDQCDETSLDLQYMGAIVQGSPIQNLYEDYGDDLFVDWIYSVATMKDTEMPSVLSISYGISESLIVASGNKGRQLVDQFDTEVKKLGLHGVTVIAASGDHGSVSSSYAFNKQCVMDVTWPASSPYVTAVGATMGPEAGNHRNLTERVCNAVNQSDASTGGGFSKLYPLPNWQAVATGQYLFAYGPARDPSDMRKYTGRGVPDLSIMGNNFLTRIGGQWYRVTGTSASAPVFAGMVTLINGQRVSQGNGTFGWLNPTIYNAAAKSNTKYFSLFNDIVEGSNDNYLYVDRWNGGSIKKCPGLGWVAAPGWDAATGLGTPKFQYFKSYIVNATATRSGLSSTLPPKNGGSGSSSNNLSNVQLATLICVLLGATLAAMGWGLYRRKIVEMCSSGPQATVAVPVMPLGGGAAGDGATAVPIATVASTVQPPRRPNGYRQAATTGDEVDAENDDDDDDHDLPVADAVFVKVDVPTVTAARIEVSRRSVIPRRST